ncbi:MAG: hypothetical protein AB7N91_07400 [Candidatus Tectimicrobiota bacterium]
MLIRFGPNQEVQRTPGQTDSQGRFLFENLETGSQYTYFIGVRHNDQLHRSAPVTLPHEQLIEISVDLGRATQQNTLETDQQSVLHIANQLLVIVKRDTHLEVREIIRLMNTSATPYPESRGATAAAQVAFQLSLPQGAYNISQVQGLAVEHIRTQGSSLVYVAPLAPGEHRITFSYNLPWRHALTTVLLERFLPTSVLDLLVEDANLVATSDLQFGGQVTIDPHTFAHFRGLNVTPQMRFWVQITPPTQTSTVWFSMVAYSLIVLLALLGLLIPLRLLGRHNTGQQVSSSNEEPDARSMAKHCIHELALLETRREAGTVSAAEYRQRQQEHKEHLRHVVEHFHSA